MPLDELKILVPKLTKEKDLKFTVKNHDEVASVPPTHLKNNKIVKSFETIVQMYGTPNYTELDPTAFVAITAFLMFGFMFGDVGQGLVIAIIGWLLKKKKINIRSCIYGWWNIIYNIWIFIWKYIWKRRYYKTNIYITNGKY